MGLDAIFLAATGGQRSTSTVLPATHGEAVPTLLVINALVMSHGEGVGGGWDREVGGWGWGVVRMGGRAACITSRCPLKLPGG